MIETVIIFLDLPIHREFRVGQMPLLSLGTVIEFDLRLENDSKSKTRDVKGPYVVKSKKLKYFSKNERSLSGLVQFLEMSPFKS